MTLFEQSLDNAFFTSEQKQRLFAVLRELATDIETVAGVTFNQALSQLVSK